MKYNQPSGRTCSVGSKGWETPNIRIWAEFRILGMHRHLLATYQPNFIFIYIMYKYQHYAYWESKQAVYGWLWQQIRYIPLITEPPFQKTRESIYFHFHISLSGVGLTDNRTPPMLHTAKWNPHSYGPRKSDHAFWFRLFKKTPHRNILGG